METEQYQRHKETVPKTHRNREAQSDQIRSPPSEMMAEKPEVILRMAVQVQVPRELPGVPPDSLDEDYVEDFETIP